MTHHIFGTPTGVPSIFGQLLGKEPCHNLCPEVMDGPLDSELAEQLQIDGQPLDPPRLLPERLDEVEHQLTQSLSFLKRKDPAVQREKAWREEVCLPLGASVTSSGCMFGHSFARIVHRVLEPCECVELIACANRFGFSSLRSRQRCIVDSPDLSAYLFEVLQPHLPETFRHGQETLQELNERCRFTCYTPGQGLDRHCDACYQRPSGHAKEGQSSRITVQLYLHDVPKTNGGATTFVGRDLVSCQPSCGSALIFTQDLLHEGSILTAGLKYTMRTEALYRESEEVTAARELQEWIDAI